MNRGHHTRSEFGFKEFAALFCYAKLRAQQSLGGRGPERHNHLRFDQTNLSAQPGPASGDLLRVWFLVNATLTARLPLEMLHNISDVDFGAIDSGFCQSL